MAGAAAPIRAGTSVRGTTRQKEDATWSQRSNRVFYGSALLIIVDFAAFFWPGRRTVGLDAFAFIVVLILAGYAMYRVWRAERSYGY